MLGLLALMLLQHSRRDARTDAAGDLVLLEDQDRARWDHDMIDEGLAVLDRAIARPAPGPYQLQAAIAALHARAPRPEDTDWPQIAASTARSPPTTPSPGGRAESRGRDRDGRRPRRRRWRCSTRSRDDSPTTTCSMPRARDVLRRLERLPTRPPTPTDEALGLATNAAERAFLERDSTAPTRSASRC